MLTRLLERRDRARTEPHVICLSGEGPLAETLRAADVPVHALDMRAGRPSPSALRRLIALLRTIAPDVVQTWLYHADLVGTIATAAAGGAPLVWNIRCAELDSNDHPRSLQIVLRLLAWTSRRPAAVICNSKAGKTAHEALGYRPRRWIIVPNGFDTERFRPNPAARAALRSAIGVADEAPMVGLLARYHPMKDHVSFLRAARVVLDARRDVHFVCAGRDIERNEQLRTLVETLALDGHVHLVPEISDSASFLAALDVAASSSYSEAFPNVIGEAMACGVPCVATDVGESANIVGETGRVVAPRQPEKLAEAVLDLLAMAAADRQALGEAARARIVCNFSLDRVTRLYADLYDELAGRTTEMNPLLCAE